MIKYEDALKNALEKRADIDRCTEYENGYVFNNKDDDKYEGGNYAPVVILKSNGKAVNMPEFIINHKTGKEIKSFDIE